MALQVSFCRLGFLADFEGRYVLVHGLLSGVEVCFLNVYAQNVDDGECFSMLEEELILYVGKPIIKAWDFNYVLDGQLDRCPARRVIKLRMTIELRELMTRLNCKDIWRELYPNVE
ncbi:hypothetical protein NDU88_007252 [Pleurodeles waltl]|uniref:Uncharacterized protein n=1 Tax=Pleurodeles waltl TaxID=8319 RepID=A0AAV7NUF0_PLEWA|nr:hypothetical protein NDU88_007252 [Pleurodeles waltl]